MKNEIENIIQHFKSKVELKPIFEFDVRSKIDFILSNQKHLASIFQKVTEKYTLPYIQTIDSSDVHLTYWRGSGDFGLALCPDSQDGVHNRDEEYGLIIPDFYDSGLYENYLKERKLIEGKSEKYTDEEEIIYEDASYRLHDWLYHSIIAYIWQENEGQENGLISSIIENNSIRTFVFNDFSWSDYSNYYEIKTKPEFRKPHFKRKLSLIEIYARCQLNSYGQKNPIVCHYEKDNQQFELWIFKNQYKEKVGSKENIDNIKYTEITFTNDFDHINVREAFRHFKAKSDELINTNWSGILKNASP